MFTVLGLARIRGAAVASLSFVLLFQACYSAAPVYLSSVVAGDPAAEDVRRAILIFILLYFLPYPLSYAAALFRVIWRAGARRAFYEKAYAMNFGRTHGATDRQAEQAFTTIVSATGQQLLGDCLDFAYGSASLLFSSTLSVVLISIYVLPDFVLAYLLSAMICALLLWRLGGWQARMAAVNEKHYNGFVAVLPEGWLASTLGEERVLAGFMRIFLRRWKLYLRTAFNAMNAFQAFDLLQAACIWSPASILILMKLQSMSITDMVALAIVLPRLTETLLDISSLVAHAADYLPLKGRADWLNQALAERPDELASRFSMPALRLRRKEEGGWCDVPAATPDDAAALLGRTGRYLLSGANGSGKTSLLLMLKTRAAEGALYLPAHAFLFPGHRRRASTGQRKLRELRNAVALSRQGIQVLLLDEWDANLDTGHRENISGMLDELAATHLLVEVSHRSSARQSHRQAHSSELQPRKPLQFRGGIAVQNRRKSVFRIYSS